MNENENNPIKGLVSDAKNNLYDILSESHQLFKIIASLDKSNIQQQIPNISTLYDSCKQKFLVLDELVKSINDQLEIKKLEDGLDMNNKNNNNDDDEIEEVKEEYIDYEEKLKTKEELVKKVKNQNLLLKEVIDRLKQLQFTIKMFENADQLAQI
eukprot:TRINITY_DN10030_c0_g1_i2.p1 TRINITY_DN10030_c0_g1~~TRINITY_DN10030_c0_g1_i2.p1  ORF type:complete len:174 (+),score=52.21 TRINITY_DN10030_c0_g1_i2:58-522(+)